MLKTEVDILEIKITVSAVETKNKKQTISSTNYNIIINIFADNVSFLLMD